MILLGINAGLGNTDCALLQIPAIGLKSAMLDYRPDLARFPREALCGGLRVGLVFILLRRWNWPNTSKRHSSTAGTCSPFCGGVGFALVSGFPDVALPIVTGSRGGLTWAFWHSFPLSSVGRCPGRCH
jgi:hypothetical protein